MTDTHTHIYMPDVFPDGGLAAAERAIVSGVGRMVLPCVDLASLQPMARLHGAFPGNTAMAIGLHPTETGEDRHNVLDAMEGMLPGNFAAIGEVGIDLYHDVSHLEWQREAFARQLGWAVDLSLPVIIHCREGRDATLGEIRRLRGAVPQMVFHSFTGTAEDVGRIREVCDPWFGVNGVVTFKNAPALREALPVIGLDRILLETDSPWLSPAPRRGQTNESANIPWICRKVAEVLAESESKVEEVTDANALRVFFSQPREEPA